MHCQRLQRQIVGLTVLSRTTIFAYSLNLQRVKNAYETHVVNCATLIGLLLLLLFYK